MGHRTSGLPKVRTLLKCRKSGAPRLAVSCLAVARLPGTTVSADDDARPAAPGEVARNSAVAGAGMGFGPDCALSSGLPRLRRLPRRLRLLGRAQSAKLRPSIPRPDLSALGAQHARVSCLRHQSEDAGRAAFVRILRSGASMDQ